MLHPICFLPTLYTDTDMSIFGMVIVLAFQICILLMGSTASFSSELQSYESWHEFPIDLLYKDVSSLDTKWRHGEKFEDPPCPNSQYIGTLVKYDKGSPLLIDINTMILAKILYLEKMVKCYSICTYVGETEVNCDPC